MDLEQRERWGNAAVETDWEVLDRRSVRFWLEKILMHHLLASGEREMGLAKLWLTDMWVGEM